MTVTGYKLARRIITGSALTGISNLIYFNVCLVDTGNTTMTERVENSGLSIDSKLYALLENEILPGTGTDIDAFWSGLASIVDRGIRKNSVNDPIVGLNLQGDGLHALDFIFESGDETCALAADIKNMQ